MRKLALLGAIAALAVPALATATATPDAHSTAQKNCRAQRTAIGDAAFKQLYGTNKSKSNAFGKCVSKQEKTVKANNAAAKANAAKACKAEQQALGDDAFNDKYATNKTPANAKGKGGHPHGTNGYGKCVSAKAKAAAAAANAQQNTAIINAAKACKAERKADPAAFKAKYGSNKDKSNAFGKCVSAKAKAARHS